MTSKNPPAAYGRFVRTARIWAALNALIAPTFVLPAAFLITILGIKEGRSLGTPEPFALLLGGVYVWAVLRVTGKGLAAVGRPWGYPERHWEILSSGLKWANGVNAFLGVVGLLAWCYAIVGRGPFAEQAPFGAVVVDAFSMYALLANALGMADGLRHATVVPYFESKVGEIETFARGEAVARRVGELDELARSAGARPLSEFGWNDDFAGEQLNWHEPAEGLATVKAVIAGLQAEEIGGGDHAELIDDLKRIAHALARAAEKRIRFCLLLRHSTATNGQEWEVRRGTCF